MKREKLAQRLGHIWNSPCRQVFSPGCHCHSSSRDCPHLPPACHRFHRSLEQLPRADDLKPASTGVTIICVPEKCDSFTLLPVCKQPTFYSFMPLFLALCICCTTWRALGSKNQNAFVAKAMKESVTGGTWGTLSPSNQPLESLQSAHLMQSMENGAWCALLPLKLFL